MKKDLQEVVSTQSSIVLTLEEQLAESRQEALDFQTKFLRANAMREKWYRLYLSEREARKSDKQDRATFAKRATEAEQKLIPKHNFIKRLYDFIITIDKNLRKK